MEDAYKIFNDCIRKYDKISNGISYQMIYQNLFDANIYKKMCKPKTCVTPLLLGVLTKKP